MPASKWISRDDAHKVPWVASESAWRGDGAAGQRDRGPAQSDATGWSGIRLNQITVPFPQRIAASSYERAKRKESPGETDHEKTDHCR